MSPSGYLGVEKAVNIVLSAREESLLTLQLGWNQLM